MAGLAPLHITTLAGFTHTLPTLVRLNDIPNLQPLTWCAGLANVTPMVQLARDLDSSGDLTVRSG